MAFAGRQALGDAPRRRAQRHVLFLHELPDGPGGSQVAMLAEARVLESLGWKVSLVHGQRALADATADVFASTSSNPALFDRHWSRRTRAAFRSLADTLRDAPPELVHVHLWAGPVLLEGLRRRGHRVVVTAHVPVCPNGARFRYATEQLCETKVGAECVLEGYHRDGCGTTSDGKAFGLLSFCLATIYARRSLRALARCHGIIAPSRWQKRMLVADGVPPERIEVIAPPVRHLKAVPGLRGGAPPVVLAAARLTVLKGLHHLLLASARIERPHVVRIAGTGPAEADLRDLALRLGIDHTVQFLGELDARAMAAEYSRASVVVMPSLWPETFGMVGPEALLAGARVIAYVSGGTADWAREEMGVVPVATGDVPSLAEALDRALGRTEGELPATAPGLMGSLVSTERHGRALGDLYEAVLDRAVAA